MAHLTPHFTLKELTRSAKAEKLGLINTPTGTHLVNLSMTAVCMETVRRILGDKKITITSGYRSAELNKAVGGTTTSHHALGLAVDFRHEHLFPDEVALQLAESPLVFDQLIYEPDRQVVHISFHPLCRRQVLTQTGEAGSPLVEGIV